MSIAIALSTKKYGMVLSDGHAWYDNMLIKTDWDKTFKIVIGNSYYLGCHTGILVVQHSSIAKHFEIIIVEANDLIESEAINYIEDKFSNILANADENEYGPENNIIDILLILPSKNIVRFNFILDINNKTVSYKHKVFQPMKTYSLAVIGEDNLQKIILRKLNNIRNLRFTNLNMVCEQALSFAIRNSKIKADNISICGGKIFKKS